MEILVEEITRFSAKVTDRVSRDSDLNMCRTDSCGPVSVYSYRHSAMEDYMLKSPPFTDHLCFQSVLPGRTQGAAMGRSPSPPPRVVIDLSKNLEIPRKISSFSSFLLPSPLRNSALGQPLLWFHIVIPLIDGQVSSTFPVQNLDLHS